MWWKILAMSLGLILAAALLLHVAALHLHVGAAAVNDRPSSAVDWGTGAPSPRAYERTA